MEQAHQPAMAHHVYRAAEMGAWVLNCGNWYYPFLRKLYADGGYQVPLFRAALGRILRNLQIDIVKRSDTASGFQVLPKRWIVERSIAWLNRCRRLAKDWENLNLSALSFLRLASIRLMIRKLCKR